MKNNEFEKDNWLEEELKREKRNTAWDFDEGSKVAREHEENCDARHEYQRHTKIHESGMPHDKEMITEGYDERKERLNRATASIFSFCFLSVFALMFMGFANGGLAYAIIAFLGVNPGIFILSALTKNKPISAKTLPYWLILAIYDAYAVLRQIFVYMFGFIRR